jgi:two-component system sensor histidine kinase CiaH
MFHYATLKLTGWYLFILMSISLLFSVIIYQVATSEIDSRLEIFQRETGRSIVPGYDLGSLRSIQAQQASINLLTNLLYINILILGIGGIGSYLMARRTIEPIEQAHEAQSRFTSDASHELRTPLAAMKTELEVALRDPHLTKEEMKELLTSNLEEVNKLTQISQTLLLLSRLEHSGITTGRVAIDDIVRRLSERFNRSKQRIVYSPPSKPLYITANQVSIEELATILLDNALKYSPPASKVRVILKREGKKARLDVINTGKGIKAEDLPHIFDRFYRVDESRTSGDETGYGLGLSLAKKIVELHNGDLSASSAPNHETVFTVLLPLYEKPSKAKRKSAK